MYTTAEKQDLVNRYSEKVVTDRAADHEVVTRLYPDVDWKTASEYKLDKYIDEKRFAGEATPDIKACVFGTISLRCGFDSAEDVLYMLYKYKHLDMFGRDEVIAMISNGVQRATYKAGYWPMDSDQYKDLRAWARISRKTLEFMDEK